MPDDTARSSLTRRMCDGLALEIRRPRLRSPRACRQECYSERAGSPNARGVEYSEERETSKQKHFPCFIMKAHTKQLSNHEIKQQIYPFAN